MGTKLTPLEVAERLIGPQEQIAALVGYQSKAPYVWRRASQWREPGDFPSARIMRRLLDHSEAHGLGLTAEHLVRGAETSEVEAILAARRSAPAIAEVAAE